MVSALHRDRPVAAPVACQTFGQAARSNRAAFPLAQAFLSVWRARPLCGFATGGEGAVSGAGPAKAPNSSARRERPADRGGIPSCLLGEAGGGAGFEGETRLHGHSHAPSA